MANRIESRSARISDLAPRRPVEVAVTPPPASVPDALEKLTTATQGMIAKRIDLLQLDTHELISSLVVKSALIGFGLIVALAAWVSAIAALVLWIMPGFPPVQQIGAYALINGVIAVAVIAFALRERLPKLGGEREAELDSEAQAAE